MGASLGGLAGLTAQGAAAHPLFRALVLVDITPKLETGGVQRVVSFMVPHPEGFASLEEPAPSSPGTSPTAPLTETYRAHPGSCRRPPTGSGGGAGIQASGPPWPPWPAMIPSTSLSAPKRSASS